MGAATTFTVNDGAATPVAHTFSPMGKDEKGVLWFEQTVPTPANVLGSKRFGYKQTRSWNPGAREALSKVVISLALPTLETPGTGDNGYLAPPKIAYKVSARVEYDLPERSVSQERKDLRVLLNNSIASTQFVNAIENLNVVY
jgi:hypothetical protein